MTISNELLDELLKGCRRPEDLLGDTGLMKELKVRLMERMLGAELSAHLGYEAGAELPLAVPRDRQGSFEPELVKKGETRIDGIDDKIVGLYAAGLSVRDSEPLRRHWFEPNGERPSGGALRAAGVARPDQPRRAIEAPLVQAQWRATPCWTRSGNGNTGRWTACIPS